MTASAEELETWELNTPGRVSMQIDTEYGDGRRLTAKGKGQRIRLTAKQRRIVQEKVRDKQNDPFTNGKMSRLDRATAEQREAAERAGAPIVEEPPSADEMNDETLNSIFLLDTDDFESAVKALSEFNVRRLKANSTGFDAKASQIAFLNDYIAEQWPITSGDTKTYREMQERPDSAV